MTGESNSKHVCDICGRDDFATKGGRRTHQSVVHKADTEGKFRHHGGRGECVICETVFEKVPSSPRQTCSNDCQYELLSEVQTTIQRVDRECGFCFEKFEVKENSNQQFCSKLCANRDRTIPAGLPINGRMRATATTIIKLSIK